MRYQHTRTPWFSPEDGYHPMMTPLRDAIDHLAQATESDAGYNKVTLAQLLAQIEHYVAFLRVRAIE